MHSDKLTNLRVLALVCRNGIKIAKEPFSAAVASFGYPFGYATIGDSTFVLLGVYRPGSRAVSEDFFDELTVVLELLSTFRCQIIVSGNINIHVDVGDDWHAVRLTRILGSFH